MATKDTRVQGLITGNDHEVRLDEVKSGKWITRKEFEEMSGVSPVWTQRMLSQCRRGVVAGKLDGKWFISKYWADRYMQEIAHKNQPGFRATGSYERPTPKALRIVSNLVLADEQLDETSRETILDTLKRYKDDDDEKQAAKILLDEILQERQEG